MNTQMDRVVEQVKDVEDVELAQLGKVSEETKGSFVGSTFDGGYGYRKL